LGLAPFPREAGGHVPFTGGQLVVPENATAEERAGAVAFWAFLMQPENVEAWVKASYFLPVRKSVEADLAPWYEAHPERRAGVDQLDVAVLRPARRSTPFGKPTWRRASSAPRWGAWTRTRRCKRCSAALCRLVERAG